MRLFTTTLHRRYYSATAAVVSIFPLIIRNSHSFSTTRTTSTPKMPITNPSSFRIRPSIVLFGDSLTEQGFGTDDSNGVGWAGLLSGAYTRRADVLNRGFSGYNTKHAVELLLPKVFTGPFVSEGMLFCTVFFGANDAALPGEPQHVPMDQYADNIDHILTFIRARMMTAYSAGSNDDNDDENNINFPIIVMAPPPVHEKMWAEWREIPVSDRSNEITRQYGLKLKEVVETKHNEHCEVLDTWELLQGSSQDDCQKHLSDGLHLNESGNRLIYKGLINLIQSKYPHLAPAIDDEDDNNNENVVGIPIEEASWKELS